MRRVRNPLRARGAAAIAGLLAVLLATSEAQATRQLEEELVIDGLAYHLQSTPLESWLEQMPQRPVLSNIRSSACWRGYVGTWVVHGGHLELLRLRKPHASTSGAEAADSAIPLTRVFGERQTPIRATWFSGVLRLAMGRELRPVSMGFGTRYQKSLFLRVEQGRVTRRWEVDNLRDAFSRSTQDLQWVALAAKPPPDDGLWHDARALKSEAFLKSVASGTTFHTRGVLHGKVGATHRTLWIPDTPASESVHIKVLGGAASKRALAHVEVTGTWLREDGELVLKCQTLRLLDPGETIHHPSYKVPGIEKKLRQALDAERQRSPTLILDRGNVEWRWGEMVELMAPVKVGQVTTMLGVEVRADGAIDGKDASATGRLEKWIVTKRLLATNKRAAALFGKRGRGTYYRLADPTSGVLARASAQ